MENRYAISLFTMSNLIQAPEIYSFFKMFPLRTVRGVLTRIIGQLKLAPDDAYLSCELNTRLSILRIMANICRLRRAMYVFHMLQLHTAATDPHKVTKEDVDTLKNDWLTDNVSNTKSVPYLLLIRTDHSILGRVPRPAPRLASRLTTADTSSASPSPNSPLQTSSSFAPLWPSC